MKHLFTFYLFFILAFAAHAQVPSFYVVDYWLEPAWTAYTRNTNTFNPDGTLASNLGERYLDGAWINLSRVDYTYDTNGDTLTVSQLEWDSAANEWENGYLSLYSYNGNVLESILTQRWEAGTWQNYGQITYSYDAGTGNKTSEIHQVWYTNGFENSLLIEFEYSAGDQISETTTSSWLEATNSWISVSQILYTYTPFGKVANDARLIDSDTMARTVYSYDSSEALTSTYLDTRTSNGEPWVGYDQHYFTYYPDGSLMEELVKRLDDELGWVNHYRLLIAYEEQLGIDEPDIAMTISPNPTVDELHISFAETKSGTITLADLSGKVVARNVFSGAEQVVSISDLPAGYYLLTINANGRVATRKILKS